MKFKIDSMDFKNRFIEIVKTEVKDYMQEEISSIMHDIINVIEKNILKIINEYNTGKIERYSGDFSKRVQDNADFGRNMPLIKSGDFKGSLQNEITESTMDIISARIFSKNIEYATWLEEGNKKLQNPYRVFELALIESRNEIEEILKGRVI